MGYHILEGNWKTGWALDLHTVHSTHNDDGSFNNERTKLGESLYMLKYKNDYSKIDELANEAAHFIQNLMVKPYISVILPTPPSKTRQVQPVIEMAKKISEIIVDDLLKTIAGKAKNIIFKKIESEINGLTPYKVDDVYMVRVDELYNVISKLKHGEN